MPTSIAPNTSTFNSNSQPAGIVKLKKKTRFRRTDTDNFVGADTPLIHKGIYKQIGVLNRQVRTAGLSTSQMKSIYLTAKCHENSISREVRMHKRLIAQDYVCK